MMADVHCKACAHCAAWLYYLHYRRPRNNVVQCNNARSRNMAAATPRRAATPLKKFRFYNKCWGERSHSNIFLIITKKREA